MKLDKYEEEVLAAFESGALIPIATKEEIERIRDAARATTTKGSTGRLFERGSGTQTTPGSDA